MLKQIPMFEVWPLEVICPRCLAMPGTPCPRLFSVQDHPERAYVAGYQAGVKAAASSAQAGATSEGGA